MLPSTIINKYKVVKRLGKGSFGEVCLAVGPNREQVAIKFEKQNAKHLQLRHEYKVYRELMGCYDGFCRIYFFGTQHDHNILVMDLLGPSLDSLLEKCNNVFSLKTVLRLADQIFDIIDTLHKRALIHRDIKPGNFAMGIGEKSSRVFCVDFGLSKRYANPKENYRHNEYNNCSSLAGTPRYASINNHLGISQSRRDDLESIAYMLIQFLKGSLPWQGLKARDHKTKYKLILAKKKEITIPQLCAGLPRQFADFLQYARSLQFTTAPDMTMIKRMFRELYEEQGFHNDPNPSYDWELPKDAPRPNSSSQMNEEANELSDGNSGAAIAEGDLPADSTNHSQTPPPIPGVNSSENLIPIMPPPPPVSSSSGAHIKAENNGNSSSGNGMPPPVARRPSATQPVMPPPVPNSSSMPPAVDMNTYTNGQVCWVDLKAHYNLVINGKKCEECKNKRGTARSRCPKLHPEDLVKDPIKKATAIKQLDQVNEPIQVKDALKHRIMSERTLFSN